MSRADQTLEDRVGELSARVQNLEVQLEHLRFRLESGDVGAVSLQANVDATEAPLDKFPSRADVSEEVLTWAGKAAILPRLATLCFLLVVALILRTITDSGMVDKLIGSALGMSYAAGLMIVSWHKYTRKSPLAPVFAACGAILMSTIVVETHTHFKSLPLVPAYLTLMATGIGMALISRQFSAFTPISVGTLGMCVAGSAIDYPHPFFPYLSMVLLTANLLGHFAAQLKRCSWLRWTVLIISMTMLQLWGFQLGLALRAGSALPPELASPWFLPVLAIFAVIYLGLAILGIRRSGTDRIPRFDLFLPTLSVIWAFTAALNVINAYGGSSRLLGVIGVLAAIGHLAVAFWLAGRGMRGAPGASSFIFAGGALLAMALPSAFGIFTLSLPIISMVAIFMAIMSRVWISGTVRVTTYVFQIYCSAALVFALHGNGPAATDAINILPAGLLACFIVYQYQWCRRFPPESGLSFFSQLDHNDRSATLLLVAGLVSGFYMMRIAIHHTLQILPFALHSDTFRCSQSVLINSAAIGLILFAYLRRNKEIRNIAILVTVVGAIKVFLYDLVGGAHGLPLVFSVFSFGMAAAIESVALGKWQQPVVQKQESEEIA